MFKIKELKAFAAPILAVLGITSWAKDDKGCQVLLDDQVAKMKEAGFSDTFLNEFKAALATNFAENGGQATEDSPVVAGLKAALKITSQKLADAQSTLDATVEAGKASQTTIEGLNAKVANLQEQIKVLSAAAEQDSQAGSQFHGAAGNTPGLDYMNDKQLFGLTGERFGLDRKYNQRARAAVMAAHGYTGMIVPKAASTDFSTLQADLGEYYNQRYQDRLQSFLMTLPSIHSIMPEESGYQDLDTLVNVFLGEFSQADNSYESDFADVVKGKYDFEPETLKVYPVMFAHTFKNLKIIEKTWIGYLNREASNPVKLSLIEFLLTETVKALHNERENRYVNGVRKEPVVGQPSPSINAADGLYEYMRKRVEGYKDYITGNVIYQIKPFELGTITKANIGDIIKAGTEMVPAVIRDSGACVLYLPSLLISWYAEWRAANNGTISDYRGGENGQNALNHVIEYPSVAIKEVKNADAHRRLIWTLDGNFHTYCQQAGEMTDFSLEQEDWKLKVWSNWKEGLSATMVGKKQSSAANTRYDLQMIFCNEYDLPADYFVQAAADVNPSAAAHTSILTAQNSALFEITDIEDAKEGVPVTLKCGSTNYGVKITASNKFSLLGSAWEPAIGDTITLVKRSDGKFIEVARTTAATAALAFSANDTTPSVEGGTEFVTNANTQATAITKLDDAVVGTIYTIHGAGSTNASTIANSGNFVLTAAMTLSNGKWIQLIAINGGKFAEIARG